MTQPAQFEDILLDYFQKVLQPGGILLRLGHHFSRDIGAHDSVSPPGELDHVPSVAAGYIQQACPGPDSQFSGQEIHLRGGSLRAERGAPDLQRPALEKRFVPVEVHHVLSELPANRIRCEAC